MTDTGLILGEPSSYLLFTILFSLTLSFSLLFPLEDSIKEYYHHTEEETEDYEPCATVFNPRITKHCDLRGEGVEKWSCLQFGRGDFIWCVLCLGWELRELGGSFIGEWGLLGCGVVVMEQVTRGSMCDKGKGGLLPATMAVGALQKGAWVAVVRMEVGTRARGTGEWWGQ
jgi:hypothetical protein